MPGRLGSAPMVLAATQKRRVGFVAWDADNGVPELLIPLPPTSTHNPEGEQRAATAVRALADGTPLLLAPDVLFARFVDRARAIRLADPVVRIDLETTGLILDALVKPSGEAVVLERVGPSGENFRVRKLRPDGDQAWALSNLEARYDARLLTDARGRVFLGCDAGPKHRPATDPYLIRVDDGSGAEVARWDGADDPAVYPDGRVGFVRYDQRRDLRDWVILDPETGAEAVVRGTDETWDVLGGVIGIDAEDRVYGRSGDLLGRMTPNGELDWEADLTNLDGDWRAPRKESVTPDGEVLIVVETETGIQVIGLRADVAT
jgi:hypothetical protein